MTLDVLDELTLARLGRVEVWVSLYWDEPYNTEGELFKELQRRVRNQEDVAEFVTAEAKRQYGDGAFY